MTLRKPTWMGLSIVYILFIILTLLSCGQPEQENSQIKRPWTADDSPNLLTDGFEYVYGKLPRSGETAKAPWAGSYWPTYKDGINDKWEGAQSESPTKKYEKAFKISYNLEDRVSNGSGIGSLQGQKKCEKDNQCESDDICAKRNDVKEGKCIPKWFGLCHAWAPASIMEPEPVNSVVYNGVTFKVNDLKALLTLSYTSGLEATIMSRRCEEKSDKIKLDIYGNPIDMACIDTNPGSLHVVVANMLGIRKHSFIEDRRYDSEVWNHPVSSFKINSDRNLNSDEANTMIGILGEVVSSDKSSGKLNERSWSESWVHETGGADGVAVSLTGDSDVDLYVKFDGEASDTNYDCRSADSSANETCVLKIPPQAKKVSVKVYSYKGSGIYIAEFRLMKKRSSAYTLNPNATSFKYVNMQMSYVGESDQSTDGNLAALIANYTLTDHYEYILELDTAGKIIGGEWLGSSRRNHPDFLWLPIKKHESSVHGVDWTNVKMLLTRSIAANPRPILSLPYCVANNGRGEGDIFDCVVDSVLMKCAKTDRTYAAMCISKVHS